MTTLRTPDRRSLKTEPSAHYDAPSTISDTEVCKKELLLDECDIFYLPESQCSSLHVTSNKPLLVEFDGRDTGENAYTENGGEDPRKHRGQFQNHHEETPINTNTSLAVVEKVLSSYPRVSEEVEAIAGHTQGTLDHENLIRLPQSNVTSMSPMLGGDSFSSEVRKLF